MYRKLRCTIHVFHFGSMTCVLSGMAQLFCRCAFTTHDTVMLCCALPCLVCCSVLRWLPKCSLIKHAFEALCINEFDGLEFQLDEQGRGMKTGGRAGGGGGAGVWLGGVHMVAPRW